MTCVALLTSAGEKEVGNPAGCPSKTPTRAAPASALSSWLHTRNADSQVFSKLEVESRSSWSCSPMSRSLANAQMIHFHSGDIVSRIARLLEVSVFAMTGIMNFRHRGCEKIDASERTTKFAASVRAHWGLFSWFGLSRAALMSWGKRFVDSFRLDVWVSMNEIMCPDMESRRCGAIGEVRKTRTMVPKRRATSSRRVGEDGDTRCRKMDGMCSQNSEI